MKTERILSYTQSQMLTQEQLDSVFVAGGTASMCAQPTHNGSWDGVIDGNIDW